MFSTEDVRELFSAFPPPKSSPTLLLASSGHGFITQEKLRNEFDGRLAEGKLRILTLKDNANVLSATGRISVLALAHDLDVEPDTLLHWIRHRGQRAVLSGDSKEILSNNEVDVITKDIRQSLETGIVAKSEYETSTHVKFDDLQPILNGIASELVYHDDYVCTQEYDELVSDHARDFLDRAVNNIT